MPERGLPGAFEKSHGNQWFLEDGVFADGNERLACGTVRFTKLPLVSPLKMFVLLQNKAAGICGLGQLGS